jgi:ABC-type polysaccharide/polyol phosphate transport system ATPase subunit
MALIQFNHVSKTFNRTSGRALLRVRMANWWTGSKKDLFYALKDVSFHVERGEGVAVIGSNGAGKSTLLGLVAGLSVPDEGSVSVSGRVAALLELGSGFHPDLTGAENVRLNASLIGLTAKRTAEVFDEIVDFSGVREFISEPLRTYSSGMIMRLAFAVAVHCDPEVLIIDEVLVVGDQAFQAKCFDKIHQFRREGKTLLCVSHSPAMVRALCDRAIWLEHGKLVLSGSASQVLEAYGKHGAARANELAAATAARPSAS